MTLDDIESRARRHLDDLLATYGRLPPTRGSGDTLAYDLARAVLAMVSVVRAAVEHEDTRCGVIQQMNTHNQLLTTGKALSAAVDALRHSLASPPGGG